MAGPEKSVDVRTAELAELGLMTASLLHELRDPIFALRAHLQLLRAGIGGSQLDAGTLAALNGSVDDIESLVSFYGGVGRGHGRLLPVDVAAEVQAAAAVLGARGRRRGVGLSVDTGDEPLWVIVRPITVRQVLMNLTNNALDAVAGTPHAEVKIWCGRDTVGGVVLSVDDNGPGWPESETALEALTDPWVTTKGEEGSGLGLYLTRCLLEEAGGRLVLDGSALGGAQAIARWPGPR